MKANILHPKIYVDNITSLSSNFFKKNGIKGIIVDMDNTLLNHKIKIKLKGLDEWIEEIKKSGIKIILVSNSIKRKNVKKTSEYYKIPYVYWALKPLSIGIAIGAKKLELKNEEIAVIGDQIFTDVLGANRRGMYSILVKPLKKTKESFFTRVFRIFEKKIIEEYLKEKEIKTKDNIENEENYDNK